MKRDLRRYFTNPAGYVFITLFILLSAGAAFWQPRFFLNNLANLDQLNSVYLYLLVFFLPAMCMNLWSEERKTGTDELLLTLPATDAEIVLGKYGAALGIFTGAAAVSLSHVIVLAWLGQPDAGLMLANYLGYWLTGAALIPLALVGSLLASNATLAFLGGVLLCALPVAAGRFLPVIGLTRYFGDFNRGVTSLDSLVYLGCLGGLFLYVGVMVLASRRWRREPGAPPMWPHAILRVVAVSAGAAALIVLTARVHARLDLTAERLYSLSPETRALVQSLPGDRQILVQAFVSPEMPGRFVQLREDLLGLLREIEAIAGANVGVAVHDTEVFVDNARLARERYNILPRTVVNPDSGEEREVYLGFAVTSGAEEQVVPFLDNGLSPEYELVRAIRMVTSSRRKRVGIVDSDVRMLGGVDYPTGQLRSSWAIVDELRRQYDVVEITPADAQAATVDVLIVAQPSRLTQTELDLVAEPVKRGVPTMIVVDPVPVFDTRLAPAAEMAGQIDPYRRTAQPSVRVVYGNIRQMLTDVGLNWAPARVAWDRYNPHPDMAGLPPETVFVAPGNGSAAAFNRSAPASRDLQELLLLYPGYFLPADGEQFSFEPLVQTGTLAGTSTFFDVVRPTPSGFMLGAAPNYEPDGRQYALAARVRSKAGPINVIALADLDFVSDNFFRIRSAAPVNARFDNITFFMNAVDVLAGDESLIALRRPRGRHRTLDRVEAQTRAFMERRIAEEQKAGKEAQAALDAARERLKNRVGEMEERTDLDAQARAILIRNIQETESRELGLLETKIEETKNARVRGSREEMERALQGIRTRVRLPAVLVPPLPVFLLGLVLFWRRRMRERDSARLMRRLNAAA